MQDIRSRLSLIHIYYESPAEVRAAKILGASAVGMSTGCEAIAANHMGMQICGISCVTNMAAGMSENPLSHQEVQENACLLYTSQYINNENRLSCGNCDMAKTILGIAMAEMIHLQKLGQLIFLLGGTIDFSVRHRNGKEQLWTPEYIDIPEHAKKMLLADIESEKGAIYQYRMHMRMIKDNYINAVLARIIKDEEYHIMMLSLIHICTWTIPYLKKAC